MKKWISLITLVGMTTQTTYAADLSESCKQTLLQSAMTIEKVRLTEKKQVSAGEMQAAISEYKGVVDVRLTDDVDGRSVSYKALLTDASKQTCEIKLERDSKNACRYSVYEGEDNLARIPGFTLDQSKVITGDGDATRSEAAQITKMLLDFKEDGMTLKQLIETTSDQEVLRYDITTSDNKKMVYYKYYAAETAVGTFFRGASTIPAGQNVDGDICIKEKIR